MSQPVNTYESLIATLRGLEHTPGETCQEQDLALPDMCAPCRSAHEMERIYKDYKRYRASSNLYENMRWDLAKEASIWREVARNMLRLHVNPDIVDSLTEDDIEHIIQAEYGKVSKQ